MIRDYSYLFKVVLVGNSSVGKSSIIHRFADDSFQQSYLPTIGVDFRFKSIKIDEDNIKLQIWDTAGQERFRTITGAYYKGAHAIILVYDITNSTTFEDLDEFWLQEVKKYSITNAKVMILGNKIDQKGKRRVEREEIQELCKREKVQFKEVSAKTGQGIAEAFYEVAQSLTKIHPRQTVKGEQHSQVNESVEKRKKEFQLKTGMNVENKSSCC